MLDEAGQLVACQSRCCQEDGLAREAEIQPAASG